MDNNTGLLQFFYLAMMLLQVVHIFEEIACGAYKIKTTLGKYLLAATALVTLNFVVFSLILVDVRLGYWLGLFTSGVLGFGNGIIHLIGYVKTKTFRDSLGAGVFSGIPLGILGLVVFNLLVRSLN